MTAANATAAGPTGETCVGHETISRTYDVSVRQVMRWAKDPTFPAKIKIGRLTRFRLSDVVAWVAAQAEAR